MLFDTHCHLNDPDLYERLDDVLQAARGAGIGRVVVPAFDHPSLERALEISHAHAGCYAAVGFHPHDVESVNDESFVRLAEAARDEKVVAIGEIGMDFHYDYPKDLQEAIFRQQIRVAHEVGLPIVIHDRDAHGVILSILKEERAHEVGGIMHCFSGSVEMALACVEMNFYISLGGPVTFKNAKKPQEVAANVPLDRLLIETDAPWLAPHPYRGKQNEPAHVRLVAERIAEIRGMPLENIEQLTWRNACRVFQLPEMATASDVIQAGIV